MLFVRDSRQEVLSTWILRPNILELLLHRRMVSLYMWTLDKSFSYVWWWCWTWTSKRKLSLMAVLPGLFLLSITEPLVRTAGFIYSAGEKNHLFTAAVALVMSCYGDGMKSGWLRLTWTKPLSGTNNEWNYWCMVSLKALINSLSFNYTNTNYTGHACSGHVCAIKKCIQIGSIF